MFCVRRESLKKFFFGLRIFCVDFLRFRGQQLVVGSQKSSSCPVTSGVPKGSVLGPLLFISCIAGLSLVLQNSEVFLFADDCKLLFLRSRKQFEMNKFQEDLNRVSWARKLQWSFSLRRCKIMHFGNSALVPAYVPENYCLEAATEIRDLRGDCRCQVEF